MRTSREIPFLRGPVTPEQMLESCPCRRGTRVAYDCYEGLRRRAVAAFRDRTDAGRQLAEHLSDYVGRSDAIVLALPRGGVPVACEVAAALGAPLDVFLVRKLGVPGQEELAMGAIASGGVRVLNEHVLQMLGISDEEIDRVAEQEEQELERREWLYRNGRPAPDLRDRTVILIDDGLATGSTMRAAVQAVRMQGAREVVVAVPVAAPATCDAFRDEGDNVVCALTPEPFYAVGLWYDDFSQTTDEEVRRLLEQSARERSPLIP
jgi:predicted phosphoribosyltransferase